MEYDQAARQRLGREVRAARTRAGHTNRESFANLMKRSGRQVQALENGESGVGPDTWAAAAEVLGWPLAKVYELLDGVELGSTPSTLTTVTDEELAAEVLRRMKAGDGDVGRDAASMTPVPNLADRRAVEEWLDDEAARDVGRQGSVAKRRQQQDEAGQPVADDPTDVEPR